ncbi:hypothetical protein [Lewinella sp. IMCC34191]|uniref:hypothetical protein n=1 Tax=Lewinella sp. IMCC34191 TaxID=2259172 RepID=UPI0013008482|nr:hypothetical protein [Lewinella sp. IMCC34191]
MFLISGLILYGFGVLYYFYRGSASKSAASAELVGKTETDASNHSGENLLGKTREQKSTLTNGSTLTPCEACGHVQGTTIKRPRKNSYGVPIDTSISNDFPAPTLSPSTPLTVEFEPVEDGVDLASLASALEKVTAVTYSADSGVSDELLAAEKADAFALFEHDDLLNSEVASQLALQLDHSAPTDGYSAVDALSNLKAA